MAIQKFEAACHTSFSTIPTYISGTVGHACMLGDLPCSLQSEHAQLVQTYCNNVICSEGILAVLLPC